MYIFSLSLKSNDSSKVKKKNLPFAHAIVFITHIDCVVLNLHAVDIDEYS